jgi:serine/threonine-protein kinase
VVPKVFDFGLFHPARSDSPLGGFGGTLLYAAPERVSEGEPPGPESDVWSLGVMLFECLTGEVPFPIADRATLFEALVEAEVPRITELLPDLPAPLGAAIERAMSRSRKDRYPNGEALHRALTEAAQRASLDPAAALDGFWRPLVERAASRDR